MYLNNEKDSFDLGEWVDNIKIESIDSEKEERLEENKVESIEENKVESTEENKEEKLENNKVESIEWYIEKGKICLEELGSERKALNESINELKEKIKKARYAKNYQQLDEFEADAEVLKERTDKYKKDKEILSAKDEKEIENIEKFDKLE